VRLRFRAAIWVARAFRWLGVITDKDLFYFTMDLAAVEAGFRVAHVDLDTGEVTRIEVKGHVA